MLLSILLICVNIFLLRKLLKRDDVNLFLKIVIAVSYLGWNMIPLLLSNLSQFNNSFITSKDLYQLCSNVNQGFFACIFFLVNILMGKVKKFSIFYTNDFQYSKITVKWLLRVGIVFVTYSIFENLTSSISYWDNNNLENLDSSSGLIVFISHFAIYALLALVLFYSNYLSKKSFLLSLIIVFAYYLSTIYSGARINLFAVIIVIIYYAYKIRNKHLILLSVILGVIALGLLPTIASLRGDASFSLKDFNTSSSSDEILSEIYTKTNSVNTSAILIQHDGIGGGGSQIYMSTALALVPRMMMPNKPHPGSKDGTLYGLPSRLAVIYSTSGEYNGITNVGISSSIEMLWALGWFGLFFLILITSFLIIIFNQMLNGGKFLFVIFFLSLVNFPVCQIDVALSTLLISVQRYSIITLAFYIFFNRNKTK